MTCLRQAVCARACGQRLHHVAARDGADQAPVPADDGHALLGGDRGEDGVKPAIRLDDGLPEIEEAGDGLVGSRGGEPVGEDAADEPPVPVGDEPGAGARPAEGDARLGHRLRGRQPGRGPVRDLLRPQNRGEVDMLDEPLDILGGRMGHDILGLPDLDHLAVLHQDDAAAERDGLVEVVRDEDDGLLERALKVAQLRLHVAPDQRIEGAERLIHEEDVRIRRERPRETRALLHAAGQLARILRLPALEADEFDRLHRPLDPLLGRDLLDLEPESDIPEDGPVGQQGEVLEDHAESLLAEGEQFLAPEPGDVHPVHDDPSAGRFHQPVHAAQERRLAGAGQAHQDKDLALLDVERDVAQSDDGTAGGSDVALLLSLSDQIERRGRVRAEYLADTFKIDPAHGESLSIWSDIVLDRNFYSFILDDQRLFSVIQGGLSYCDVLLAPDDVPAVYRCNGARPAGVWRGSEQRCPEKLQDMCEFWASWLPPRGDTAEVSAVRALDRQRVLAGSGALMLGGVECNIGVSRVRNAGLDGGNLHKTVMTFSRPGQGLISQRASW